MFVQLTDKNEISKAQQTLERSISRYFPKQLTKNIGFPGGTEYGASVFTDEKFWFWSGNENEKSPRYLNWFGLFSEKSGLNISVEINVPHEGSNGRVAGFYARDINTGSIYLMHSGGVRGGKKGVGPSAFLTWSMERLVSVSTVLGGSRKAIVVMPIQGRAAARPAFRYTDTIAKFKQAVRDGETDTPEFKSKQKELEDYYSEFSGRKKGSRTEKFDYLSRHGDVVDALYSWRKSKPIPQNGQLVKNVYIDLGVSIKKQLSEIYEVKTSADRNNIYTAIGQLITHSGSQSCKRIIVLPENESISFDLQDALDRMKIKLIHFKLLDDKAIII